MLRIPAPVVLLLLALVIPRLPAIPTGAASKHRVPRTEAKSDLEDDTDVLVQDVDQVITKMNKALGDTGDSVDTDPNDGVKGLSVKTTEVRISPPQDQKSDESDEDDDDAGEIPEIPVEPSPGEEEALLTGQYM
ncbi:uncharacterized protein [Branchiostoma lanceolatum]|uniref:uncharacterized protein n=1 Tax=Branchiostoma lanceolatum TaxID=7740 RepID=UPI0034559C31